MATLRSVLRLRLRDTFRDFGWKYTELELEWILDYIEAALHVEGGERWE